VGGVTFTDVSVAPYIFLLGVILALLGLVWFFCLIAAMRPLVAWLRHGSVMRALDRLTGGIFVVFGVGLAGWRSTRARDSTRAGRARKSP